MPKLDAYLSDVISFAYKNPILISNPALSRNPYASSLLLHVSERLHHGKFIIKKWNILSRLLKYYVKSFVYLFFYFLYYLTFKFSKLTFDKKKIDKGESLFVIDTFMMIDRIIPRRRFEDSFFGSLYEILEKRNKQSVILCILFGGRPWNLKSRLQTYNILASDKRNFITEFDLMTLSQWVAVIRFIVVYPLVSLRIIQRSFGEFDEFLREEIINTLDSVQFINYLRYEVGLRLKLLTNHKIKLAAWYENHVVDKLLIRGIRDSGSDALIYGCTFIMKYPQMQSYDPLVEEAKQNVLPDIIFVTGKYHLNKNPGLNVKLGISPRYNYIHDIELNKNKIGKRRGLLLLLSYYIDGSKRLINIVKGYSNINKDYQVTIKFHPNHVHLQPFKYPEEWDYTEKALIDLYSTSSVVVTTSFTGAALEVAIMGCSVIIVGSDKGITSNPMPEYGKGKIWDMVFDSEGLGKALIRLSQYRHKNPDDIVVMANELRDLFLTKATEQRYVELFDL
jgi:hypothetical protein